MGSQLKVDTITGVTTAGSVAVTGEGNSTTTNLQQGLIKQWSSFDQRGTAYGANTAGDTFNTSSHADESTANATVNLTNNMNNTKNINNVNNIDNTDDMNNINDMNINN